MTRHEQYNPAVQDLLGFFSRRGNPSTLRSPTSGLAGGLLEPFDGQSDGEQGEGGM